MAAKTTHPAQVHEAVHKREAARPVAPRPAELTHSLDLETLQRSATAPDRALSANILTLQRTVGNRAVQRLIQTKSLVQREAMPEEEEALNRVTQQVIRMPALAQSLPAIQRSGEKEVRMKSLAAPIAPVIQRAAAPDKEEEEATMSQKVSAEAPVTELEGPTGESPEVPNGTSEVLTEGESDEFEPALASNETATASALAESSTPAPSSASTCTFPVRLGRARGCGSGTDFTHFDHPSISTASAAKLAAWAVAHVPPRPARSLVTDTECETEMAGVLMGLAGSAGLTAFSRFRAGTGGAMTHGPTSTLGAMALISGSFLATLAKVKADIEAQLAAQAWSGSLDACALSVTPPATHFAFSDGATLKAVIGGTQGEELFITSFSGSIPTRSYTIGLRFLICDDFGVDESDLYAPGLFPFWVLQHERSASLYAPFINQLDLPVTVSGTF